MLYYFHTFRYQKTTSIIGGITGNITNKIGQMRHSESFRSIEEKVGSAYENVKVSVLIILFAHTAYPTFSISYKV